MEVVEEELAELAPRTPAACDSSQLAAAPSGVHVNEVSELLKDFKLVITNQHLPHQSSINWPSIAQASGAPKQ